ncbi:hypothetical protein CTheo_7614 [Ceratobasidium theobromae]|uniref:TPR-like protein n=1 Tax=Ceratobasidium theobromae TaxID=1582974 RepID=A0A5N5QB17_9AGAM|nr:hypothetical protein CTheo_7614 [Ceratobasidium theobromae]
MSLFISYQPPTGDALFGEMGLSESYEQVIEAACKMWGHYLPADEQIAGRYLARQIERGGNLIWARLSESRFAELIRNGPPDELELQLQIDCIPTMNVDSRQATSSPSTLEIPPSIRTDGNNAMEHQPMDELGSFTNNARYVTPLTPSSSFREHRIEMLSPPTSSSGATHPPATTGSTSTARRSTIISPKSGGSALFDSGLKSSLSGWYIQALAQFKSAAQQYHEIGDARHEADCLVRLGVTRSHLKDFIFARSHFLAARSLYESLGDECLQEKFQCDRHLARIEEDTGNLQAAMLAYQELKSATKEKGLLTEYAWCSYYLGHLFNRMKRFDEARSNLKDAIDVSRTVGDIEIQALATEDTGYATECEGDLKLAVTFYRKALKLFKAQGKGKWVENESRVRRKIGFLVIAAMFTRTHKSK